MKCYNNCEMKYSTSWLLLLLAQIVIAPIGRIAAIDYSLVDNPTFTSSYISTRHKVMCIIPDTFLL